MTAMLRDPVVGRRKCLKLWATLFGGLVSAPLSLAWSADQEPGRGSIRRQLGFTVSLSNPTATELKDQVLWLYMPASRTATQELESLNVSMAHTVLSDSLGHSILRLSFPQFAPLASKVVSVSATVSLRVEPKTEAMTDASAWLGAERFIEADAPSIRALAAELKCKRDHDTARAIFDWVRQNLQYPGYIEDDLGALDALTHRRGDCTEYAYLAVALARANGIPARMAGGYVTERNTAPRAQEYHNWAEVYFDQAWRLLDPQKGNWLHPTEQYIAFRYYRDAVLNDVGSAHRFKVQGDIRVRL